MVAPKSGSVNTIVAAVVASVVLGFVLACASTVSDRGNSAPAAWLTEVQVDSGTESSAVTLVGLSDSTYTAAYDADLQAVVIELVSVDAADAADRVEVYDGTLHGWCPPDSTAYNEAQAERAWARLLVLFETALA